MNIKKLIKKLGILDTEDLKLIKDRIDFELSNRSLLEKDIFFFDSLMEFLKKDVQSTSSTFSLAILRYSNKSTYEKLCRTRINLDTWLKENKVTLSKSDKNHFYGLFYKIMKLNLEKLGIPLGLKTILNLSDDFPGFFNQQFPGYCKSGLVNKVFPAVFQYNS